MLLKEQFATQQRLDMNGQRGTQYAAAYADFTELRSLVLQRIHSQALALRNEDRAQTLDALDQAIAVVKRIKRTRSQIKLVGPTDVFDRLGTATRLQDAYLAAAVNRVRTGQTSVEELKASFEAAEEAKL